MTVAPEKKQEQGSDTKKSWVFESVKLCYFFCKILKEQAFFITQLYFFLVSLWNIVV